MINDYSLFYDVEINTIYVLDYCGIYPYDLKIELLFHFHKEKAFQKDINYLILFIKV